MMVDVPIHDFPKRKKDNSVVVEEAKHTVHKALVEGQKKGVVREMGIEVQTRLLCKGCGLEVAYRSEGVGRFTYFVNDAMTVDPMEFKKRIVTRRREKERLAK